MSKINVRSPYFIYDNSTDNSAALQSATLYLWIYTGNSISTIPTTSTYSLFSTAIDGEVTFEISELVRDCVENNFDGNYDSNIVWVNWSMGRLYVGGTTPISTGQQTLAAFDGYGYFEEGANPQNDSIVLQSNDLIYTNDFANINIPIHVTDNTTVTYFKDGESIFTKTLLSSTDSSDQVQYVSNSSLDADVFYNRVIDDGGTIESFSCVRAIADGVYAEYDADKIYIDNGESVEVINVEEIEECKYTPYKITFVNKFGALQDVWFFKKSSLSMKTKQEDYKANIVSAGSYSINERQNYLFNKTGTESLKLNTGFYPESYNEVFRQLSLSEEMWINYEKQTLPINISSSSLNYKTRLNDKLINYTIDVEFSNDKINNIR
jgi:hypothetical protein